jgi:lipopolysaccharide transport system permease protein
VHTADAQREAAWGSETISGGWAGDGLLLVVGHPRSGTTFLGKVLGAHPDAVYIEEPGFGSFALRTLREIRGKRRHVAHDTALDPVTTAKTFASIKLDAEPDPAERRAAMQQVRQIVGGLVEMARARTGGARIVIDKTPGQVGMLDDILGVLPHARVIHIIRDPRAVYRSAREWTTKYGPPEWLTTEGDDLASAVGTSWVRHVSHGIAAEEAHGAKIARVRYEDLLADPEPCTKRLLEHMGLPWCAEVAQALTSAWGTGAEAFRADAWTTEISRDERRRVEEAAGSLLDELGYERTGAAPPERAPAPATDDAPIADETPAPRDPAHDRVVVYRAGSVSERGHLHAWRSFARSAVESRQLIAELFRRDFLSTFRKSHIGLTWLFLAPVFALAQWLFLRNRGVLETGDLPVPYAAYLLLGTTMWGLFVGFYRSAASTLQGSASFLQQVRFPHETLVFKQLGQATATFAATLVVATAVLVITGTTPHPATVALPFVLFPLVLLATAIGLVVAMVAVVSVDIDRLVTATFGLLMFVTPIVYAAGVDGQSLTPIARWNPLTYLVLSARDLVLVGELFHPVGFVLSSFAALGLFGVALRLFHVSEPQLIERLL